jgi:integrase
MARTSDGAWFRKGRGWYCTIGERQIPLVKTDNPNDKQAKQEAERLWHVEMSKERDKQPAAPVSDFALCPVYECLASKLENRKRKTGENEGYRSLQTCYQEFWDWLKKKHGEVKIRELKPFHVLGWLDSHQWNESSRSVRIRQIKAAFNAWVNDGHLEDSPLKKLKIGKILSRTEAVYLSPEQRREVLAAIKDDAFRDFWFACNETGCRPGEVAAVQASDFDEANKCWRVVHKSFRQGKTDKKKPIHLTDAMVELTKRLAERNPEGPLFRNNYGERWQGRTWGKRFEHLQRKLKLPSLVAYSARHSFITDALLVMPSSVVGAITNQTPQVIERHYSHVSGREEELREKLKLIRGANQ